jgi:PAS domain S-box-containing protein
MASPTGVEKAILTFVCGLRRARELRENLDSPETEQALQEQLGLLERFAGLAPMNFSHKLSLVQAEVHRARGEILPAMQAYEKASQDARVNDYLNEAGLVHTLAAEFYQDLGLQQAAMRNLEQAALDWQNWGAHALVENLEERFADLLETSGLKWQSSTDAGKIQTTNTQPITPIQLDVESIISASQMLSAEIDLEQLLNKMIALVMANSGAEKAVLLMRQENDWFVQAQGDSSSERYDVLLNQPFDPTDGETNFIPESVFNYCQRSKEVLVVGNAMLDQRFSQDRTIQKHHVLSLACFPVLSQGKLSAMLYLENCQLADVFILERQQVIKHLSTQFGISVEKAMLYDGLKSKKRELEVSETRFRSLVENAEEAIVVSQDNLVKYANLKVEELSGYSVGEMTNMEFEKFIHPDDLNIVLSEYQLRLSGEKLASKYSIRIISKQGQTKYVYVNSALIDWDGRPATLALITDITQLKKVESDLRISKERYELALSGSDAGIWDYSISTGKIYYSDRFKELMGYEPHEMNDHTPEQSWNNLHPDFREIAPLKLNQHLNKETPYYHMDYLVKTKSGEYRWFQARGKAVWDENGNPIRVAGSFIDIHEKKIIEKKQRISEERFRKLMQHSPLSIAIFTPDGKISQVNDAWKKLWGFSEEEAARMMENYNFISDKQFENLGLTPLVERAFKGETIILPPITYEGKITTDELGLEDLDAHSRTIQVHIYSVKDDKGEIDYVVGINMDLTELKRAEQEARMQREALARMDRSSIMGQVTGSISHELNQPLTGILANAQAIELMLSDSGLDRDEIKEVIGDIISDTKRAGEVIRNLRDIFREHKGEFYQVDLNAVVRETIQLLHSEMIFNQIRQTVNYAQKIPLVEGNRIQLQQVLLNLILNGIEAMKSIIGDDRHLHVETKGDQKEILVWIDDKGTGIEPKIIGRIFEPMATWKPGGMGMGLAISNTIIRAHGGRMFAENRPEGGARVGFVLPVKKKE